ncbi:hypothetical protein BYT27DRAFT_7250379 [Phlegmacium glaucopus]|nr:hypothetical protein BYT27DRAFT_7250379 [Phlegmacium glaucopus]
MKLDFPYLEYILGAEHTDTLITMGNLASIFSIFGIKFLVQRKLAADLHVPELLVQPITEALCIKRNDLLTCQICIVMRMFSKNQQYAFGEKLEIRWDEQFAPLELYPMEVPVEGREKTETGAVTQQDKAKGKEIKERKGKGMDDKRKGKEEQEKEWEKDRTKEEEEKEKGKKREKGKGKEVEIVLQLKGKRKAQVTFAEGSSDGPVAEGIPKTEACYHTPILAWVKGLSVAIMKISGL